MVKKLRGRPTSCLGLPAGDGYVRNITRTVHKDGTASIRFSTLGPVFDLRVSRQEAERLTDIKETWQSETPEAEVQGASCKDNSPDSVPFPFDSRGILSDIRLVLHREESVCDQHQSKDVRPNSAPIIPSAWLTSLFDIVSKSFADKSVTDECMSLIQRCIVCCRHPSRAHEDIHTIRHVARLTVGCIKAFCEKNDAKDGLKLPESLPNVQLLVSLLEGVLYCCFDRISNYSSQSPDNFTRPNVDSSLPAVSSNGSQNRPATSDWRAALSLDDRVIFSNDFAEDVIGTVIGINNFRQEVTLEYAAAQESRITFPLQSNRFRPIRLNEFPRNHNGAPQDSQNCVDGAYSDLYRIFAESGDQARSELQEENRDSEGLNADDAGEDAGAEGDVNSARSRSRSNSDASNNSSSPGSPKVPATPRATLALDKSISKYFSRYSSSCELLFFPSSSAASPGLLSLVNASINLDSCLNSNCDAETETKHLLDFLCRARELFSASNTRLEDTPLHSAGTRLSSKHYDSRKKNDGEAYPSHFDHTSGESSQISDLGFADEVLSLVTSSSSASSTYQTFLSAAAAASYMQSQLVHNRRSEEALAFSNGFAPAPSHAAVRQSSLDPQQAIPRSDNFSDLPRDVPRLRLNSTNDLFLLDMHTAALENGIDLVELAEGVAAVMHDIDQAVARATAAGVGIHGIGFAVRGGVTALPNIVGVPEFNDGSSAVIDINGGSHSISSQQVIQAAVRRRNEFFMLRRLQAAVADDTSLLRGGFRGLKGALTSAGGPPLSKEYPPKPPLSAANTFDLADRKSRLSFSVKLMDYLKRRLLLIFSDYAEEVASSCRSAIFDPLDDRATSASDHKSVTPTTPLHVLGAALACMQALVAPSIDPFQKGAKYSCGNVVFQHIVHLFISRYGLRCRVLAENRLRVKGVHDLIANQCVPTLQIISALEKLEQGYTHVLGEILVPSAVLLRSSETGVPDDMRAVRLSSIDMLDIFDKMKMIGDESGLSFLCDKIVEHPLVYSNMAGTRKTSSSDRSGDFGLKSALRMHLLLPNSEHRYNKLDNIASYNLRVILRYLAKYGSVRMLTALENMWREVIADQVEDLCNCANNPDSANSDTGYESGDTITSDRGGLQTIMNGMVDVLIHFLHKCREICRVDLAHKNMMCHMSADLGFMLAYNRLDKPIVLELAKALSVRVSSLLDSLKQQRGDVMDEFDDDSGSHSNVSHADDFSGRSGWVRSLDLVIDLIQVLCNQTNNMEFSHFYELLLARRLLRHRYISLSLEQRVLSLLPGAMSKNGPNMIRDMKATACNMQSFRAFVLEGIDSDRRLRDSAQFPSEMLGLIFQDFEGVRDNFYIRNQIVEDQRGRLNIHLLSGNVWPSNWVSCIKYSSLKLPVSMIQVMDSFQHFFDIEDTKRVNTSGNAVSNSADSKASFDDNLEDYRRPLVITGGAGGANSLNGFYEWLGNEMKDGMPVYSLVRKVGAADSRKTRGFRTLSADAGKKCSLEFSSSSRCWQLKTAAASAGEMLLGRKLCVAYIAVTSPVTPDKINCKPSSDRDHGLINSVWKVHNRHNNRWEPQHALTVTKASILDVTSSTLASAILGPLGSRRSSEGRNQAYSRSTPRRLVWCHSAGSAVVKVNLSLDLKNDASEVGSLPRPAVYILASEPQVAAIFAFNSFVTNDNVNATGSKSNSVVLTVKQISKTIGLSVRETCDVVESLLNLPMPILQKCSSGIRPDSFCYRVSDALLRGAILSSEEDPFVVSTTLMDNTGHSNNNSHDYESIVSQQTHNPWGASKGEQGSASFLQAVALRALHDWRNEVIDACIVRILKQAMVSRTGEYTSRSGVTFCAVPLDLLTESVRLSISSNTTRAGVDTDDTSAGSSANFITVSDADIIRRSERLVSTGVIDKISTSTKDSFRTIAYCYISSLQSVCEGEDIGGINQRRRGTPGGEGANETMEILAQPSPSLAASSMLDAYGDSQEQIHQMPRMTGTELFNQLKLLLGVHAQATRALDAPTLAPFVNSLSLSLFESKFAAWLATKSPLKNATSLRALYSCMLQGGADLLFFGGEEKLTDPAPRNSYRSNASDSPILLEELALSALHTLAAGAVQLTALKYQHWEGITGEKVDTANNFNERARLTVSFEPLFNRIIRYSQASSSTNSFRVSSLLGLSRCYFEHLPTALMARIAEIFATFVGADLGLSDLCAAKVESDSTFACATVFDVDDSDLKATILTKLSDAGIYCSLKNDNSLISGSYTIPVSELTSFLHPSVLDALLVHADVSSGSINSPSEKAYVCPFPMDDNGSLSEVVSLQYRRASLHVDAEGTTLVTLTFVDYLDATFTAASEAEYSDLGNEWRAETWDVDPLSSLADAISVFFFGNTPEGVGRGIVDSLSALYGVQLSYDAIENEEEEEDAENGSLEEFNGSETTDSDSESSDEFFGETTGRATNETIHEPMIPCEFCSDVFRVSQLEIHQRVCGRIELETIQEEAPDNTSMHGSNRKYHRGMRMSANDIDDLQFTLEKGSVNPRPGPTSPVVISLAHSLLQTCSILGGTLTSHDAASFERTVSSVFSCLDTDGDSYLTASDFSGIAELSYEELRPHVDPFSLYRNASNSGAHIKHVSFGTVDDSAPDLGFDESSQEIPQSAIPGTLPFTRADSLWMSISSESAVLPSSSHLVRSTSLVDVAETYEDEIRRIISKCSEVLDEGESTTLALLLHYKWDCKLLVEDYVCERGHREVRDAMGLGQRSAPPFLRYDMHAGSCGEHGSDTSVGNRPVNGSLLSAKSSDGSLALSGAIEPITCLICGTCSETGENFYALHCLHWFCFDCWQGYFLSALGSRNICAVCPMSKCRKLSTPAMYTFFCGDEIIESFQSLVGQSFIEEQGRQAGPSASRGSNTSYCKNPRGCAGVVIMADDADSSEAFCSLCGSHFCATCDLPPHAPATCELVANWEAKGGYLETGKKEDEEARKLKHLTTKPCPKCGVRIEKNGGCPHMICMQATCKYQFCWDCSGEYHTSSQCSRPKITVNAGSVLAFDEYDKKCANHFLARKVALRGVRLCMSILERTLSAHTQSQALALRVRCEAWQVLSDAQSALAHSCAVMFFTPESAKLQFLYDELCAATTTLQSNLEEGKWMGLGMGGHPVGRPRPLFVSASENTGNSAPALTDPEVREAAAAVANLRRRWKEYLLLAATEILPARTADAAPNTGALTPPASRNSRRNSRRGGSSPGSRSNSRPGSLPSTPLRPNNSLSSPSKGGAYSAGGSTASNSAQRERAPSFGRSRSLSGHNVHRSLVALTLQTSRSMVPAPLPFGSLK